MLGLVYLPYSCSTNETIDQTNSSARSYDLNPIVEEYDEFAMDGELPENDGMYVDEIANDEYTYNTQYQSDQLKIVDFDRAPASIVVNEDGINTYQVKPFDTLMLIAHQVFGDYTRWRELIPLNKNHLNAEYKIIGRPRIRFKGNPVTWEPPMGQPYFIKPGDSLSKISLKVYGEMSRWREIFENNPRQIRDPNLIFAGFHLYYPAPSNMSLLH